MSLALIMAAGNGYRWDSSYGKLKHLVDIYGEPLLQRTCRQITTNGFTPIIVTRNPTLVSWCKDNNVTYHAPKFMSCVCDTMWSSRELWKGEVRILLGDVFWTDNAIQRVLTTQISEMFYGTKREIFAFTFRDSAKIREIIEEAVWFGRSCSGNGRMWSLYYKMSGNDNTEHIEPDNSDLFTLIEDGTRDFDYKKDYEEWRKEHIIF